MSDACARDKIRNFRRLLLCLKRSRLHVRLNAVNCLLNVSIFTASLVQLLQEVASAVHTSTAAAVPCSDEDGPGSADGTGVDPAVGRSLRDPVHVNTTRLQFTVFSNSVKFACGCSLCITASLG